MIFLYIAILFNIVWALNAFSIPNVNATFSQVSKPFKLHVNRDFIEDTRQRVLRARSPAFIETTYEGPTMENFTNVQQYWVHRYNWSAVEESINKRRVNIVVLGFANLINGDFQTAAIHNHC